jgi:hypothetical protein
MLCDAPRLGRNDAGLLLEALEATGADNAERPVFPASPLVCADIPSADSGR